MKVATHNGLFHADEVFATAILALVFSDLEVIRTRNPKELATATIRYDVGGKYDPESSDFDHHFKDVPKRENGKPLSSAGLIWKHFGHKVLAVYGCSPEDHEFIDWNLITPIDLIDNGAIDIPGDVFTLSQLISSFNSQWDEEPGEEGFWQAVDIAQKLLVNKLKACRAKVRADQIVVNAVDCSDEYLLLLPQFCPWQSKLLSLNTKHLFVVFKDISGTWRVQAVPEELGSFKTRKSLPDNIRGLSKEEIEDVTGIKGIIFCHPAGFIAGTTTKDAAIELAVYAIRS